MNDDFINSKDVGDIHILNITRQEAIECLESKISTFNVKDNYLEILKSIHYYKNWDRVRNYEIEQLGMSLGFLLYINEECPINGFKCGLKNTEYYIGLLNDNDWELISDNQWIADLFRKYKTKQHRYTMRERSVK